MSHRPTANKGYKADILIDANGRKDLLRDVTEAITGENVDILAVNTLSDRATATARMTLTIEISNAEQLVRVLNRVARVRDVMKARRKV